MTPGVTTDRLDRVRARVRAAGADGAWLTFLPDVRWACGFAGSNGLLVVLPERAVFLTDGRYAEQARREVTGAEVDVPGYDLVGRVAEAGLVLDGARLVVQSDHLTLADFETLQETLPGAAWVPVAGLLREDVAVKTDDEVAMIEAAQRITEAVFDELLGLLRPGVTERAIGAEIVVRQLRRGAERMAFDPIVASGPNGALPHARPTDRALQAGDLVVLDFGCVVGGFASDMTRTVAVGEPGDDARRVYAAVLEAQRAALDAARAGMYSDDLDAAARTVLAGHGLGEAFAHGLGHGVGLQTHEWPRVSHLRHDVLPAGCVVTIEPGAYLDGRFGVRIEDMIRLEDGGSRNLTRTPKELIVL